MLEILDLGNIQPIDDGYFYKGDLFEDKELDMTVKLYIHEMAKEQNVSPIKVIQFMIGRYVLNRLFHEINEYEKRTGEELDEPFGIYVRLNSSVKALLTNEKNKGEKNGNSEI